MRLFGFDAVVRKWLADKEDAVAISNCEVKKSRQGDQLEVGLIFNVFEHLRINCRMP